jgi:hypothetical protein
MPATSSSRPTRAQTAATTMPLLESDWQLLQDALAWLERIRALLEASGGMTDEDQRMLGQAVVEAYRQAHGKAPKIADRGRGAHATRVSLYEAADLPMVDRLVREMLGEPSTVEEGAHDAGVADTSAP